MHEALPAFPDQPRSSSRFRRREAVAPDFRDLMYTPSHFNESRTIELHAFMQRHPLASVVTQSNGRLDANPVPLLLDPAVAPLGALRGHVARANPVWREITAGAEVLVLFQGPDSYVSPGFYPSKQEHGRVVPTWNYSVVHARGTIRWVHDASWLHELVGQLTDRHEAAQPRPWKVSDAPEDYVAKMIEAIVGLEISITELKGKLKLSQNRSTADREGVRTGLAQATDPRSVAVAHLMRGADV